VGVSAAQRHPGKRSARRMDFIGGNVRKELEEAVISAARLRQNRKCRRL